MAMEGNEEIELKGDWDNTSSTRSLSHPDSEHKKLSEILTSPTSNDECSENSLKDTDASIIRDDEGCISGSENGKQSEERRDYDDAFDESQLSGPISRRSSSIHPIQSEEAMLSNCTDTSLPVSDDDRGHDDKNSDTEELPDDLRSERRSSSSSSVILELSSGSSVFDPQSTTSPIVRHVKRFQRRQDNVKSNLWTASGRPRSPPDYDISKEEFTLPSSPPPRVHSPPFQRVLPDHLTSADHRNESMLSMTKNEILVPGFAVGTKKAAIFLVTLISSVAMICYFAPNIFRTQVYKNPVAVTNVYQDIWQPNPKDLAFLSSLNSTRSLVDAKILHHLRLIQEKQDLYRTSFQIQLDQSAMMLEKLGSHFRSLESAYVKLAEVKKMENKVDLLDNSMRKMQQAIDGNPVGTSQIKTKKGYWFNNVIPTKTMTSVSVSTTLYSTKTLTVTETQMSNPLLPLSQALDRKGCLDQNSIMSELEHQYKLKNRQIEDFIYYSNREFSKLLQNGLRQSCGNSGVESGCTNGKFNEKQIDQLAELFAIRFQRNLEPQISTVAKKMDELQRTTIMLSQRIDRIFSGSTRNMIDARDTTKPNLPPDLLPAREFMEAAESWIFGKGAGHDIPGWWIPDEMKRNTRFIIGLLCPEEFEGKQGEFDQSSLKGRFESCLKRRQHLQRQRGIFTFLPWKWASTYLMKGLLVMEELQGISFSGSLGWILVLCATVFANTVLNVFLIWLWSRYDIGGKIAIPWLFVGKLLTNPKSGILGRPWAFSYTIAKRLVSSLKSLVFNILAALFGGLYLTVAALWTWAKQFLSKVLIFILGIIFWITRVRELWTMLLRVSPNPLQWRIFSGSTTAKSKSRSSGLKETTKRMNTERLSNPTNKKEISPETEEPIPKSPREVKEKAEVTGPRTPSISDLIAQKGRLKKNPENISSPTDVTQVESNVNVDDRSIDKKGLINKWDRKFGPIMQKKGSTEKNVPAWLAELKKTTSAKKRPGIDSSSPPATDNKAFASVANVSPPRSEKEAHPLRAESPQAQVSVRSEVNQGQTSSSKAQHNTPHDGAETATAGTQPKKTPKNVQIEDVEESDDQIRYNSML